MQCGLTQGGLAGLTSSQYINQYLHVLLSEHKHLPRYEVSRALKGQWFPNSLTSEDSRAFRVISGLDTKCDREM